MPTLWPCFCTAFKFERSSNIWSGISRSSTQFSIKVPPTFACLFQSDIVCLVIKLTRTSRAREDFRVQKWSVIGGLFKTLATDQVSFPSKLRQKLQLQPQRSFRQRAKVSGKANANGEKVRNSRLQFTRDTIKETQPSFQQLVFTRKLESHRQITFVTVHIEVIPGRDQEVIAHRGCIAGRIMTHSRIGQKGCCGSFMLDRRMIGFLFHEVGHS